MAVLNLFIGGDINFGDFGHTQHTKRKTWIPSWQCSRKRQYNL